MRSKERLTSTAKNGNRRFRYDWAKKSISKDDVVLDAGCGSTFGHDILAPVCKEYIGVDYTPEATPTIVAGMNTWTPDFEFNVFVSFENIEHVKETAHYVEIAKKAKKHIFLTCPASETISWNPYHVYDFSVIDILRLFEDENWKVEEHFLRIVKKGRLVQQCFHFKRV
jgi:hypothetical protein